MASGRNGARQSVGQSCQTFDRELEFGQGRELLFALAGRQARCTSPPPACRPPFCFDRAAKHDADRLLHALEDARRHVGLVALGRAVDDPDTVGRAAQVVAHLLEAGAVEEAGDGDEADDARIVSAGRGRRPSRWPSARSRRTDCAGAWRGRRRPNRRAESIRSAAPAPRRLLRSSRRGPWLSPCRAGCRSRR